MSNRRVLLIDDTPEIAELLTFALRDRGYEVVATGYDSAVNELIVDQHPDAVVLDCSVLEMSESLFDGIRAHPGHGELRSEERRVGKECSSGCSPDHEEKIYEERR